MIGIAEIQTVADTGNLASVVELALETDAVGKTDCRDCALLAVGGDEAGIVDRACIDIGRSNTRSEETDSVASCAARRRCLTTARDHAVIVDSARDRHSAAADFDGNACAFDACIDDTVHAVVDDDVVRTAVGIYCAVALAAGAKDEAVIVERRVGTVEVYNTRFAQKLTGFRVVDDRAGRALVDLNGLGYARGFKRACIV